MTLAEFDAIRQYLPPETEVILKTVADPWTLPPGEDWALWTCSFGNHDGRFNVMCHACGWTSDDIPARDRAETEKMFLHQACPKCGKKTYKKGTKKK